jgi:septal ring factor EnvC (AmiA/AmiB activator)
LNSKPPDHPRRQRARRVAYAALFLAATAAAEPPVEELSALRARLERLQTELAETRGERDEARERLRDSERRIGNLHRELRSTDARQRQENTRLAALEQARGRRRAELDAQRTELEAAVRAAYALGRQDSLKLLLSQDDPAQVSRTLTYYRYLTAARATRIQNLESTLAQLDRIERQIGERQRALAELRSEQLGQRQKLEQARDERRTLLTQLNASVASRSQEIERLRHDEERLARLVRELRTALARTPLPPAPAPGAAKGRWRLPVKGRVSARFGSPRRIGDLRWQGIFLASAEGAEVRAPTRGRVAYADWLRGFGLLLVLDHGNGLMTLYGHNQSLYKGVGDPVEPGETIALTGNTGGPPEPGLYFEVRVNGEPRDPLDWCKL